MANIKQVTEDKVWEDRIESANRYYDEWAKRFSCDVLERYYEGFQWKEARDADHKLYVINKIYETIQIKIDRFIPALPKFTVTPKPGNSDFNLELASQSAQLKEDVLNTVIDDDDEVFAEEMQLAYKDSFFRFAIIETGYSADWYMNPNAQKPLLVGNTQKNPQGKPKVKQQPEELPVNERVFVKHIAASRFRVGGIDHKYLHRCGWCGYFEWIAKDDLLALPGLMNRDKVERALGCAPPSELVTSDTGKMKHKQGDYLKIWKLWDNRAKVQLILLDDPKVTVFQRKFKHFPLHDYRPDRSLISEGFYPIPPVFHWISPQDELNEVREQFRKHRRRFVRKYQVVGEMVEDDEIAKFESGDDGSLVKVKQAGAISAIDNPSLGPEADKGMVTSSDDLNQISGTSAEVRGVADRVTATQANIIEQKGSARDNAEQARIVKLYRKVGRSLLLTIQDKFVLGTWARLTSDPDEQLLGVVGENKAAYQWVTTEQLRDGYDFRVNVDLTTMTKAAQEISKASFIEFLALIAQFPAIALSPLLVQEAAYRVGYRNQKVIKELQKIALMQQAGMMAGVNAAGGGGQTSATQGKVAQMTPPGGEQIRNQIANQVQ
jgi:hypothetical protein